VPGRHVYYAHGSVETGNESEDEGVLRHGKLSQLLQDLPFGLDGQTIVNIPKDAFIKKNLRIMGTVQDVDSVRIFNFCY
jgi:hypothetical protein